MKVGGVLLDLQKNIMLCLVNIHMMKNGVIPFQREEGKKHLIKNFTSIDKSVESYFHNINTHYAYKKFRKIRSKIRMILKMILILKY